MINAPVIAPGPWGGDGVAELLRPGETQYLLQQQQITPGQATIGIQVDRIRSGFFYPFGVSIQIWFTDVNGNAAAPGAFEIDLQTSDVDKDGLYCTGTGVTSVVGSTGQSCRIESTINWFRFMRCLVKTLTNPVYVTILVTR